MPGLSLSPHEDEIILDAWLGRGLVFENEIAAQQEKWSNAYLTPFWERRKARDRRQF